MRKEEILNLFSGKIRCILEQARLDYDQLREIRLRVRAPLAVCCGAREFFVSEEGQVCEEAKESYFVTEQDVRETLEYVSGYSLYAYEEEIRQGYLTIRGGHRVGLTGRIVLEGNKVKGIKYISFINIRFSHQVKGCASKVLPYVADRQGIRHTLIISPPGCGKTTLLRDLVRQLSDGDSKRSGCTVGVVDERSEISGCYQGVPQNDVGTRTDVLDGCPKAEGMMMLVRSMSPTVIAVDEIGSYEDLKAIEMVINCGCRLLATVHGSSVEDIKQRPLLERLVNEKIFERYIVLQNQKQVGEVRAIFDERGTCLYNSELYGG